MKNKPILVAGPPRSGSTFTAGLLIKHGVWVGKAKPTPHPETNSLIGTENYEIKKLNFKYKGNYKNWSTPLPEQPKENPELFKKKVLNLVSTNGPWLVKTAWLVIYWQLWDASFPEAKWVLLNRPVNEVAESAMRHPKMKSHGYDKAYNFALALQKRQKEIHKKVKNSIWITPSKLINYDLNEFDRLTTFCDINPDKSILYNFADKDKWHGAC